jgi:hypothetical protein
MSDDYYTYTEQLVAEGRRVFALVKACELADDRTPAAEILAKAASFEAWLKDAAARGKPAPGPGSGPANAKPKIAAVKPD